MTAFAAKWCGVIPIFSRDEMISEELKAESAYFRWEQIKQAEKDETNLESSLDRVARTLPSLMRSQKLIKKAVQAGRQTSVMNAPTKRNCASGTKHFVLTQRLRVWIWRSWATGSMKIIFDQKLQKGRKRMRIDKFLKVSRIIKRRTVANDA